MPSPVDARRRLLLAAIGSSLITTGCFSPWIASTGSEQAAIKGEGLGDWLGGDKEEERALRVGDVARARGVTFVKIEALGLVNGLDGTGGQPEPGRQRDAVLAEIKTHNIREPNTLVDAPETALVTVQAILPPGVQEGDPIDLRVGVSQRSGAESLAGGWLMPVRLREMRVLKGQVREGDVLGIGQGPVMIRQAIEGGSGVGQLTEGVVLGGGRVLKNRPLALHLRASQRPNTLAGRVALATRVAGAISRRFFLFDGTRRRSIAEAKDDGFIQVDVHPRYRRNVHRLMAVIAAMPLGDPMRDPAASMEDLRVRLADPATAAGAALELEGIGPEEPVLQVLGEGLASPHLEIQFYAAESLAYLDRQEALEPLARLATNEPAFRHNALRAIGTMEDPRAGQTLVSLLHQPSIETRYGAYREIRLRSDARELLPSVQRLARGVSLVLIPTSAPPLVTVSASRRAEIAVFGAPITLRPPGVLRVSPGLMVRGDAQGRLSISRFRAGQPDRRAVVPATVEGLVTGLSEVGAPYSDIVAALRTAQGESVLAAQLAVDPLPEPGREFDSSASSAASDEDESLPPKPIDPEPPVEEPAWWNPVGWVR